jgi:NAD(P)-dependent dehydrogenase (short-subunit alcohol dehydrogenase family)
MGKGLNRFKGKVAFVTGAASGIGRSISLRFADEGADIAAAVAFIASDDASYITGQAINVCGGLEFH